MTLNEMLELADATAERALRCAGAWETGVMAFLSFRTCLDRALRKTQNRQALEDR